MDYVFEIIDKTGRKIHLTKERWTHITSPISQHSYMTNYLEKIKLALLYPDFIAIHSLDETKTDYYTYIKEEKAYLLVGVKYLNGEGFVITSFLTRKLIRKP